MTAAELSDLAAMRIELMGRLDAIDGKVDRIEARVNRWDGAITFVKAVAGFVGFSGALFLIYAVAEAYGK